MSKIHFLVSNATEAQETAIAIMAKLDKLRPIQLEYANKAGYAKCADQYKYYFLKFHNVDNRVIELNRALTEVATFLPMPSNFPRW